jgi:hypothetical protein
MRKAPLLRVWTLGLFESVTTMLDGEFLLGPMSACHFAPPSRLEDAPTVGGGRGSVFKACKPCL